MNDSDDGPIPPPCLHCGEYHRPQNCPYDEPFEEDAWYDQNVPDYALYYPGPVDHWEIGRNGLEVPAYTYRQVCDRSDN